jgi:hypothetical protein
MNDDKVILTMGDKTRGFERSQVISIVNAGKEERKLWAGVAILISSNYH